jgi:hypothetical protein
MGFLVVSIDTGQAKPDRAPRRAWAKKSPDQPKPIGAKKGGEPPSGLLHRVTLGAIGREPLEKQNEIGQTALIITLHQRLQALLERILSALL